MPTWLLSPKLLMIAGAVVVAIVIGFVLFQAGKVSERNKGLQATIDAIKERDKIDGKTKSLSDADLCDQLGGVWMRDHCE